MIGAIAAGSGVMILSLNVVTLAEGLLRGVPIDKILSSPLPDFHARINPWLPISSGLFLNLGAVVSIGIGIAGMVAVDRLISRLATRSS